jgi:hypothetical protein
MKRILFAAFFVGLISPLSAEAQITFQTWVASFGSDANNCQRPTPCATLQAAFNQTRSGGEIHLLDGGNFSGVTITRSVTIDGRDGPGNALVSPLATAAIQITVSAGASDVVTIRHLDLFGGGISQTAVRVNSVGALHIENCTFNGFASRGIDFLAGSGYLYLRDVRITDVPGTAVYVANSHAALERVTINNNGTGVIAAGSSAVSLVRSAASGNGTALAAAYGPSAQINIDECMMSNNQWAVVVGQGATAYVGRSSFFNNYIKAIYNDGASFAVSYGTNQFAGNATDGAFTSGLAVR